MTHNNTKIQDANQRVCDRLTWSRRALFELDDGAILTGKTENISPRGVLMKTDAPPSGELVGMTGTLFVISDEGISPPAIPAKWRGRQSVPSPWQ